MSSWYDHAIIYQVYPKSFQDSNGDGIGDLNGIRQRIPYLQKLGINAVWLNPIFVSPQVDNGYDVANYYAIDEQIGTMAEMDSLIKELHAAGIHLILDFVLNHTSDQHPWFKDALANPDGLYRDYYIFKGHDNRRPNNWGSFFGGSVWEPDPSGTGESYFHLFDKHMPDLNWANPEVRLSMEDVARFWLGRGVDGLRIDAFIHIAKANLDQDFPTTADNSQPVLAEPFYANLPQVQSWLRPFSQRIRADYPDVFLLGEAASANVNLAVDYTSPEAHLMDSVITFRYFPTTNTGIDSAIATNLQPASIDWPEFKKTQVTWQQTLSGVSRPILYWGNHDMARVMTRVAHTPVAAASLAMLMYLQQGTPIIYYGEELGMENLHYDTVAPFADGSVDDFVETAQKAGYSAADALTMASATHKMPARGPMLWDDSAHNGFSTHKPWNDGRSDETASAERQSSDPHSMLSFYQQLIQLKQQALFEDGDYCLLSTGDDTYVYRRQLGQQTAYVVINLSSQKTVITLPAAAAQVMLSAGDYTVNDQQIILGAHAGLALSV
ncbi:glycoside hydrolase family 13 protein [Lacticaseibacillus songhuajiangensis]|jgi:alpha-glucosidase|uniref:glycoside hydrolase family 13 protein n=1 Tax=Lacticaseibacillus songhuajiangensis TaxID=1296539 RepID=UPI000F78CB37|nr:alpha-glucosidase [Lacticaseibacillus songhuajiangensis]